MVEKFEIKKETKNIPKNQLTKKELEFAKTNKKGIEVTLQKKSSRKNYKKSNKTRIEKLKKWDKMKRIQLIKKYR